MHIIHAASLYLPEDSHARRRMAVASCTWDMLYRRFPGRVHPGQCSMEQVHRTSRELGSARALPYIKDLVAFALAVSRAEPGDAVMLTNSDTCFILSRVPMMFQSLESAGFYYSARVDHRRFDAPLPDQLAANGGRHAGADLFAFTRKWWETEAGNYPDMLLGAEAWDGVLKELMRLRGFREGPPIVYHEAHTAFWVENLLTDPAQIYNRALAKAWIEKYKVRDFLVDAGRISRSRQVITIRP